MDSSHSRFRPSGSEKLPALGAERVEFMGHGALLGQQRLARGQPLFARNDRVVHGHSPWFWSDAAAEASFSQGGRWNKLISRYIAVMPSTGRILGPAEP